MQSSWIVAIFEAVQSSKACATFVAEGHDFSKMRQRRDHRENRNNPSHWRNHPVGHRS
jgi:hypothetical protein